MVKPRHSQTHLGGGGLWILTTIGTEVRISLAAERERSLKEVPKGEL